MRLRFGFTAKRGRDFSGTQKRSRVMPQNWIRRAIIQPLATLIAFVQMPFQQSLSSIVQSIREEVVDELWVAGGSGHFKKQKSEGKGPNCSGGQSH